ncbi:hypothetical protein [Candidatus Methylacidithermus pantelleriae]|nr:hypothetical protein [Candidatus Methylacidithermus pantelleriae]
MGRRSGGLSSFCSGRRTRPLVIHPAKPGYPRTGTYRVFRLRLPEGWGSRSQSLVFQGLRFTYGQKVILQALSAGGMVTGRILEGGKLVPKPQGSQLKLAVRAGANQGWRVMAKRQGEDPLGNLVRIPAIGLNLQGKSEEKAKANVATVCQTIAWVFAKIGQAPWNRTMGSPQEEAQTPSRWIPFGPAWLFSFAKAKEITGVKSASFRARLKLIEVDRP